MFDFRKLSLALGIGALTSASAFGSWTCTAPTASTPTLRGGGVTEAYSTITYTCSLDGAPAANGHTIATAITVDLGGDPVLGVTSKTAAGAMAEPTITVTDSLGASTTTHVAAFDANTPTQLVFAANAIPDGADNAATTFKIKLSGVRVAVSEVSALTPLPIPSFTATDLDMPAPASVGSVNLPLTVSTTACDGKTALAANVNVQACSATDANAVQFGVKVGENINNTFKTIAQDTLTAGSAPGFNTRVVVNFSNVPKNAAVWVTDYPIYRSTGSSVVAQMQDATTPNGDDAITPIAAGAVVAKCSGTTILTAGGANAAPHLVAASTTGAGKNTAYAVYDISADSVAALESFTIGVSVQFTGGAVDVSSGPVTIGVSANLAPLTEVVKADDSAPIPRFAGTAISPTVPGAAISTCTTTILFPYVTSGGGYETGIAIVNTSKDASSSSPLSGTGACSLNFFGPNAPTGVKDLDPIAPGGIAMFNVGEKLSAGSTFAGYLIATCQFQYGHGLAYTVTPSGGAEYLGLVLPATRDASSESAIQ